MNPKYPFILSILTSVIIVSSLFASAEESPIPTWIKNTALWWGEDQISDADFINALQWLIDKDVLKIPQASDQSMVDKDTRIPDIEKLTFEVKGIEKLSTNPLIHQALISSNQEFNEIDNVYLYIDEKDEEWVSAEWDTITSFMSELIQNDISDLLRQSASFHEEDYGYVVYAEIFVTNAYGANVAQTGKTSDYRQDDEPWWQRAKSDMIHITSVEFDESAGVYSADICLRIDDQDGNFIGIIKAVTNIDRIIEPEA